MINSFIRNYFGFNKQQRNGLLVLISISFVLMLVRIIFPFLIVPDHIVIQNLPVVERKLDSGFQSSEQFLKSKTNFRPKDFKGFVFNPNSVSYEQLMQLGLAEKTAKTFIKYRSKGKIFKSKEQLKKIHGISPELYKKLEPYILIEHPKIATENAETKKIDAPTQEKIVKTGTIKKVLKIELNSTDSMALIAIEGIGPSYAKRILKYRNILGGYSSVDQLQEVYGFPRDLFEKVSPFFSVNADLVKKINLNKDDFKTINKHPYISYELTKAIFEWRRKTVLNPTNLKAIINDDLLYQKILPYILFE